MKWKLDNEQKKELGKFLIDVAKLIFGGIILAKILKDSADSLVVLFASILVVILLVYFGLFLMKSKK
jgi:uncharacterized membrane protein